MGTDRFENDCIGKPIDIHDRNVKWKSTALTPEEVQSLKTEGKKKKVKQEEPASENEDSIQKIQRIRYKKTRYCIRYEQNSVKSVYHGSEIYEISCDGILTYCLEAGSKKWQDKHIYKVDRRKTRAFLNKMQWFSREATEARRRVDDCAHEVCFIYPGGRKEIFEMDLTMDNGCSSLWGQILAFVAEHENNDVTDDVN